jgi:hypothetical protein
MEVNDSWYDREAPERIDQINAKKVDAGQMEQPVVMESGKVLGPGTRRTTVRQATG